jgi:predicted alpha/beta superfamily hydrolase
MRIRKIVLIIFAFNSINLTAQSTATAQVSTFTIDAPQLRMEKKIWIYLPKSYESSDEHYPVIYMHDAQNLFDASTSYVGEWNVDEHLDSISERKVIIVGIEHGGEKRIDELTPFKHEKYGGGNGQAYMNFIINTVKPHIDITYRTLKDPANTTIFGSSLGGLMSFYAVLKHPETFGSAGVFSPSFWYSEKIYQLAQTQKINPLTKFYFLVGTKEGENVVSNMEKMINILKSKGVSENRIESKVIQNGEHNEKLWSSNFKEAVLWLMD